MKNFPKSLNGIFPKYRQKLKTPQIGREFQVQNEKFSPKMKNFPKF